MKTYLSTAALLALAACGGPGPAGGSAPAPAFTPTGLTVRGVTLARDGSVVPGVDVCLEAGGGVVADPRACTTSGADGSFLLSGAEPDVSITLTFNHSGYLPLLRSLLTRNDEITLGTNQVELVPDKGTFLGASIDRSKGQVSFAATGRSGTAAPKVSATAEVLDDLAGFSGPGSAAVYVDTSGSPMTGAASGNVGGFPNLSPGTYAIGFAFPGWSCTVDSGAPGGTSTAQAGSAVAYAIVRGGYEMAPIDLSCVAMP